MDFPEISQIQRAWDMNCHRFKKGAIPRELARYMVTGILYPSKGYISITHAHDVLEDNFCNFDNIRYTLSATAKALKQVTKVFGMKWVHGYGMKWTFTD